MNRLENVLENLNIDDAGRKAETLRQYMELVLERNRQVNLTAITDRDAFVEKHYADSLAVAALPEFREAQTVLDLGTGGGFPGVPLAVAFPEKQFTLVDSLNKRIRIITEFCEELGIGNVTAIHGRAEELGRQKQLRDQFDICVSRAVADLRVLAEYCLPFVKEGGWFIAYKGADCEAEVAGAERAIHLLGGKTYRILPASEARDGISAAHQLVVIHKVSPTPKAYPRRAGTPSKKPL